MYAGRAKPVLQVDWCISTQLVQNWLGNVPDPKPKYSKTEETKKDPKLCSSSGVKLKKKIKNMR
jgi:hypothetical protein